jgi:hypothetical protein
MKKSRVVIKQKKIVTKGKQDDKVGTVMSEFKDGTLKTPQGKTVTDRNQALAIALREAGITEKDLHKAEIVNKIRVYKSKLESLVQKAQAKDEHIKGEIVDFFKKNPYPTDDKIHAFAEKNGMKPSEIETMVYSILSSFLSEGKSKGIDAPDKDALAEGMKVEAEHTTEPEIAKKIADDHLKEDPAYYEKLKAVEA